MTRSRRVLLTAVAAVMLTAACSSSPSPPTGSTTGPGATGASGVPEVLDFEAPLLDGGTLRGADLAGKDVAFWFWAPW
jgi:hypothetical protein